MWPVDRLKDMSQIQQVHEGKQSSREAISVFSEIFRAATYEKQMSQVPHLQQGKKHAFKTLQLLSSD